MDVVTLPPGDEKHQPAILIRDRKSTRLNSSHGYISYAGFWLKKKSRSLKANQTGTLFRGGIKSSISTHRATLLIGGARSSTLIRLMYTTLHGITRCTLAGYV